MKIVLTDSATKAGVTKETVKLPEDSQINIHDFLLEGFFLCV